MVSFCPGSLEYESVRYPFGLSLPVLSLVEWSKTGRFPPTVRAEPVEAGACGLIRQCAWVEGGSRVVAPAGDSLFFASPKKSKQKKGDPKSATPALRFGANLRRSGCGVRRRTHCAPAAHRSNNCGKSVHEARALRRACHPATAPAQAQPQGVDSRAAEQPHGPLLRSAPPEQREALARVSRAQQWPVWLSDLRVPLRMCRGAQRLADQGSRLFERDSAGREHRRLPQRAALGTQTVGSPSFAFFSWRRKKRRCAAGRTSRHPPSNQALRKDQRASPGFDPSTKLRTGKLSPNGWFVLNTSGLPLSKHTKRFKNNSGQRLIYMR